MFSGPLFRREFRAANRRGRPFAVRTVLALVLGGVPLLVGAAVLAGEVGWDEAADRAAFQTFGAAAFLSSLVLELLLLAFAVPSLVAGAIAEERERGTLAWLLLTRLTPAEIAVEKLVARWLPVTEIVVIGLPILVGSGWAAGMPEEAGWGLLVLLASSLFMASLALLASSGREQAGAARSMATGWIWAWLLCPPMLSVIPARSGTLWGDLIVELKALAALVAPSSPISLATDSAWYFHTRPFSLSQRIALMIGLQGGFTLLALALAASRLVPREPNPNWMDPTRGYRPPCSDDPIYWREYELPMRRGGSSMLVLRLRYVVILLRAIGMTLLALVGTLFVLAIPLGLIAAAAHTGYDAFRELWANGYGPNGPFRARDQFNLVIRAATGLLAFFPIAALPPVAVGRINVERDKGTWDSLLTTPLTGAEILRAKARASWRPIWSATWPVVVLWVFGLACGVLNPVGVVLAAIDLAACAWAAIAVGLYLGIRPGPTGVAANRAGFAMLPYLIVHGPLLAAVLAPPHAMAMVLGWPLEARFLLAAAIMLAPSATAIIAWRLTRRILARFDRWVGRPERSRTAAPPAENGGPGAADLRTT